MLIPAAQQLLALPAEIDLQRRRPYINKGDLAARGSRIKQLMHETSGNTLEPGA